MRARKLRLHAPSACRIAAAIALCAAIAASDAAVSGAADPPTYVAQCSYGELSEHPVAWDVGCTGGSPAGTELVWVGWGTDQAVATGKIRLRYDTTGEYDDRIYPLFDGRIVLSAPKTQPCRNGKRQYTHSRIEWTVPDGFQYDTPGLGFVEFDIGQPCPRYRLGSTSDADGSQGLGEERPKRIWMGGDSSTVYFNISWKRWGRATAYATARGYHRPPYAKSVRVRIVASQLRRCRYHNDYVYTKVSFRKAGRTTVQRYPRRC